MPRFEPFRGIRYDTSLVELAKVTAPPYDVIDEEGRAALGARDPHNVVRIDLPRSDDGEDPYQSARHLLDQWLDDGILRFDLDASLYVVAMDYTDEAGLPRQTIGVIGALELQDPGAGGIMPHEHTTPKARSDRLQLLRACRANISAVWGLSPAAGLTELLRSPGEMLGDWIDEEGVRQRFWRITDSASISEICSAISAEPFVIADGHHRYETSLAYRDERIASEGAAGAAGMLMVYVVELSSENLSVRPIHRLLSGLADPAQLASLLEPFFETSPLEGTGSPDPGITSRMHSEGFLVLVLPSASIALAPRPGAFGEGDALDSRLLDEALGHIEGAEVTYQHGIENVVARVQKGDAQAGVLLRAPTVDQILAVARGGERMPPKTTFFYPKLKTGMVLRSLD